MNPAFDRLYRQLGRATAGVLFATLGVYGITLLCAILGLSPAVASFRGVMASLAYVFVALFGLFLMASVIAAIIRWFDSSDPSAVKNPL